MPKRRLKKYAAFSRLSIGEYHTLNVQTEIDPLRLTFGVRLPTITTRTKNGDIVEYDNYAFTSIKIFCAFHLKLFCVCMQQ